MPLKVLCVIDSLNSGGAQRQMVMLATLLRARGVDVSVLTYHAYDFFKPVLDAAGVPQTFVSAKGRVGRARAVRAAIRTAKADAVIAYLHGPNAYAELAALPSKDFALIVSERGGNDGSLPWRSRLRLQGHRLASAVVTNSNTLAAYAARAVPALKHRTHVIFNCVDFDQFQLAEPVVDGPVTLTVLARFGPEKNAVGLLEALGKARGARPDLDIQIDWYGNNYFENGEPTPLAGPFLAFRARRDELGLEAAFRNHKPTPNAAACYAAAHAVCMPSFFEGCSNVICEALACGRPVLASAVCDNHHLVRDGENGFLFNPHDPDDMAHKLIRFAELDLEQRRAMGAVSRQIAEEKLSPDVFADQYLALIHQLTGRAA